jgi:hypothetical protein
MNEALYDELSAKVNAKKALQKVRFADLKERASKYPLFLSVGPELALELLAEIDHLRWELEFSKNTIKSLRGKLSEKEAAPNA